MAGASTLRIACSAALLGLLACVPADKELGAGSVQFTFVQTRKTTTGLVPDQTTDGWGLTFDRVVLGFKTMTVGKIGTPDLCSYAGRGATSDAVFNTKGGIVQTFNGISPVDCPDVGAIFGLVDSDTIPAAGTTPEDLIALDQGGYHAMIDATAYSDAGAPSFAIQLRFEPTLTSTRFGGCKVSDKNHGVHIIEGKRQSINVYFAAEDLFRVAISSGADLSVGPFLQADANNDGDGIVTMADLDALPLSDAEGETYSLPEDAGNLKGATPTLGDFVRFQFRFALHFGSEDGICVGNAPGSTAQR